MPQTFRFPGVLRGSPPGLREQMEVGGAEGRVEAPAQGSHYPPPPPRPDGSARVPVPGGAGQRYWGDTGFFACL